MKTINLLSTIFFGTRKLTLCPGAQVQHRGPAGVNICSLNTRGTPPKISYAAVALEYILNGRVAAIEMIENKAVYAEVWDAEKVMIDEYVNYNGGNQCYWADAIPENTSHIVLPFVLFALSHDSEMDETKAAFEVCVQDYQKSGELELAHLFYFCDCFYYEWKAKYPSEIVLDEFLNLDLIRQAVRTKNARKPEIFVTNMVTTRDITIAELDKDEETKAAPTTDKYAACRKGEYRLDHCWGLEQMSYIPDQSKLDTFVPSESFYTLVDLIHSELTQVSDRMREGQYGVEAIGNNYVNAILCGKPGTGKTTLANAIGATFGMPVRTVTISKNSEEDSFQGMTKVVDGGFKFVETPFLDVYKNGGIILLEEFNLADPAVLMGALGQAIEKPFILYEDGYKEVRRHPMCVIIATMNTGTQGSREPSEAFTSRCADVFMLDDPTEEQFIDILCKNGYKQTDSKKVYKAYARILSYLTSSSVNAEDIALSITLRHCLAALRQMKIGRSFKQALRDTMCGVIGIKDMTMAEQVYRDVIEPLKG